MADRREKLAQRKLGEAEAEVEAKYWDEVNQEFESQRLQLPQANQWADQSQRDKISLYGELELRNGLLQEHHARDCQEIED